MSNWSIPDGITCQVVALSGGLDSVVLLHMAKQMPVPVRAIHVNHGLQSESSDWAAFCEQVCADMEVPLAIAEVTLTANGSIEAAAREARYQVFAEQLKPHELLLTAHHLDDQAETVLLNLMRGSDQPGVRGMPASRRVGQSMLLRPLLDVPRTDIHDYARTNKLNWIEDPSNASLDMDRNYIRHEIVPALQSRFGDAAGRLAAGHQRDDEIADLMQQLAASDADLDANGLSVDVLKTLEAEHGAARAVNVLRYWLIRQGEQHQSRRLLVELLRVMTGADQDRHPVIELDQVEIHRHRSQLYLVTPMQEEDSKAGHQDLRLEHGASCITSLGTLRVEAAAEDGLLLPGVERLKVRVRHEGEKLKNGPHHQALKQVMQETGIPVWLRPHMPVLDHDGVVVALPAMPAWSCRAFQTVRAGAGQTGWRFVLE